MKKRGLIVAKSLTAAQVAALSAEGCHKITKGLYLNIKGGGRSWLFRYQFKGVAHLMGLGSTDVVSLANAKAEVLKLRLKLHEGIDPLAEKRAGAAKGEVPTFAECANDYIEAHKSAWRSDKTLARWRGTIERYAKPVIGRTPVNAVTVDHVLRVLKPLWETHSETARKLRSFLERVLDWARARGFRSGDNPAKWDGALSHLLPAIGRVQKVRHHAAIAAKDIPALVQELRALDSISARALLFCLLTAARTGEVIGADWAEIDLKAGVWSIPAARMKAAAAHNVPLTPAVIELLKTVPHGKRLVFPSKRGKPLSNMALLEMMRGLRGKGATVHGLRATFKTWASDETEFAREVIESSLAHRVGNAVEQAYQRGTYFEKRRELMNAWAVYCYGTAPAKLAKPVEVVEPAVNPWRQLQNIMRSVLPDEKAPS